jgi:hypothetical protein
MMRNCINLNLSLDIGDLLKGKQQHNGGALSEKASSLAIAMKFDSPST